MLTPWLVYADYPRRDCINYFYLAKKAVIILALLFTNYLIHSKYIQPYIMRAG